MQAEFISEELTDQQKFDQMKTKFDGKGSHSQVRDRRKVFVNFQRGKRNTTFLMSGGKLFQEGKEPQQQPQQRLGRSRSRINSMLSVDEDASYDEFSWTGNGNGIPD